MRAVALGAPLRIGFWLLGLCLTGASMGAQIVVGPDSALPLPVGHLPFELLADAHPTVAHRFGAAVLEVDNSTRELRAAAYATVDGGQSWQRIIEDRRGRETADNDLAYGFGDTMYFSSYPNWSGPHGDAFELAVHRSVDGGKTWHAPWVTKREDDRQLLLVDRISSRFRGRLYLSTGQHRAAGHLADGASRYRIALRYSTDGGQTFSAAIEPPGPARDNAFVGTGGLFSDGTVLLPIWTELGRATSIEVTSSRDGGRTLTAPVSIATSDVYCGGVNVTDGTWGGLPMSLAVDNSAGPFRDRVYVAWHDRDGASCEIKLVYSSDRGRTWSAPNTVSADITGSTVLPENFMPSLAVSARGIVGISWYSRRGLPNSATAALRFTASTDGGESFLPSVSVPSKAPRMPMFVGNSSIDIVVDTTLRSSPASSIRMYNPQGAMLLGDTQQMVVDASGIFHPFWIDYRTGSAEVRSASVEVRGDARAHGDTSLTELWDVTALTTLTYLARSNFDPERGILTVLTRLRNTSPASLEGPFTLRVTSLASMTRGSQRLTILDTSNGMSGVGALIQLASTSHRALAPGAETPEFLLRFHIPPLSAGDFTRREVFPEIARFSVRVFAPQQARVAR